jgi:A/G-specific adenine glycosylase
LEKEQKNFPIECLLHWAENNTRDFPWRKNITPYRILVAELLLRRTTASAVKRIYEPFIEKYPSLKQLSEADQAILKDDLKTIGYQQFRSSFFKDIASSLLLIFGSIPDSFEELLSVKQVGLYTAAAVSSLGYGLPLPMVDTNVIRILSRVYGKHFTQYEAFTLLKKILPKDFKKFNFALLDLGALICRYKNPLCSQCPLQHKCNYWELNRLNFTS